MARGAHRLRLRRVASTLVAADYGAPTTRKRLFLVAQRRGAAAIAWPEPTHGAARAAWRTAAEIIDWSLPCPSIFGRKRPLAEATQRRIAAGLRRYVIDAARPFIDAGDARGRAGARLLARHPHEDRDRREPRGDGAGDAVRCAGHAHQERRPRARSTRPLRTVTTAKGGEFVLAAPTLVQTGYGEREGQTSAGARHRAAAGHGGVGRQTRARRGFPSRSTTGRRTVARTPASR